jgi:hypothetical protein
LVDDLVDREVGERAEAGRDGEVARQTRAMEEGGGAGVGGRQEY